MPADKGPIGTCVTCGAPFQRSKTDAAAIGRRRRYCDTHRDELRAQGRRDSHKARARDADAAVAVTATVAGRHTDLRLRVEAAKPLLRIAVDRREWSLVAAALAELEQDPRPAVIDLRARTGINA